MKRFFIFFIFISLVSFVSAQTRYWVGASGGLWSATSSWSATSGGASGASSPVAANDVIIDNSFTGTVSYDVASITIKSLTVKNPVNVILSLTGATGRTLTCNNGGIVTPAVLIEPGATFTMTTAINPINFTLAFAANSIGHIDGTFITAGADPATGTGGKIDASNSIVTINGTYKSNLGSSNYTGGTTTNTFLNAGSVFEVAKNGGSFPDATWNTTSLAKVTGTTISGPAFNGTAYGNLEWNAPGQTSVVTIGKDISFNDINLINTGSPTIKAIRIKGGTLNPVYTMTVNGNLTLSANSLIELSGGTPPAGGGVIRLKGNIVNNGTITEATTGLSNRLEFVGTSNQNISGTGSYTGNELALVMNGAGATLLSPLSLTCELQLDIGKIKTDAVNILTMGTGSSWTGGSSASFIEGPMIRTGLTGVSYTMPIGKGSIYAPLIYRNLLNYFAADAFSAEYFRLNPQSTYGTNYDLTGNPEVINHISFTEYWSFNRVAGSTPGTRIGLTVTDYSFCTSLNTTFVARYNTADNQWKNCGTLDRDVITPGPFYATGEIHSFAAPFLGVFTLATNESPTNNPLPITLITFDATKLTNTKSTINWELAACCSVAAKFEIQRADVNKNFITIGNIGGSATNKLYNYIDNDLKNGINYYRLKMIDEDGKITYSRTVAVMNGVNGLTLTSLIPTVVTNTATLTVASSNQQKLDLVVVDMQGRVVLRRNYTIGSGNINIELPLTSLASGIYQLTGISAEGKTNTIRFIKQ